MSLKRFSGWVPKPVYDTNAWGRPTVRRPDLEEPEWSPYERGVMLALALLRELTCRGCGGYLPETTAPERDDAMAAHWHSTCHDCVALDIKREADRDEPHPHAHRYTLVRKIIG